MEKKDGIIEIYANNNSITGDKLVVGDQLDKHIKIKSMFINKKDIPDKNVEIAKYEEVKDIDTNTLIFKEDGLTEPITSSKG